MFALIVFISSLLLDPNTLLRGPCLAACVHHAALTELQPQSIVLAPNVLLRFTGLAPSYEDSEIGSRATLMIQKACLRLFVPGARLLRGKWDPSPLGEIPRGFSCCS